MVINGSFSNLYLHVQYLLKRASQASFERYVIWTNDKGICRVIYDPLARALVTPGRTCFYGWIYGRILMKILQDTQVHLTILGGRTLPVNTHGTVAFVHPQQSPRIPFEIWKRTLILRFTQGTRKITVRFDGHG